MDALNERTDIVKMLLGHKDIDVNARNSYGHTALMWASGYGDANIVKILLGHKDIDVNAGDSYGYTASYWASKNGHDDVVELLSEFKKRHAHPFYPFLSPIGMAPASNHDQRVFEQVSPDLEEGGLKNLC